MRSRSIKPGFYTNEVLAECSIWARFIFPGLWMLADRMGRLEFRPKRMKAELLPYDGGDMRELVGELEQHGLVVRYEVEGKEYLWIPGFVKHQTPHMKEKNSVLPQCNEESSQGSTVQAPDKHQTSTGAAHLTPDSGLLTPEVRNTNTPPKAPPTPEVLPSEQGSFEGEGLNASRPSRQNGTNPRAMGNNPRGNSSNPRATGTNPRAQAELVGDGFDPDCSLEFQELRELYDREGKAEAPMTGHVEFLALCKQRLWPGIPRIAQAFEDLQQDWQWAKDGGRYRPGLAKFLRERWWEKQPDTRASPQTEKEQDGIRAAQAAYRLFGNKGGQANAYSASDTRPTGNTSQGLPA